MREARVSSIPNDLIAVYRHMTKDVSQIIKWRSRLLRTNMDLTLFSDF
jgi:hypothetical protein